MWKTIIGHERQKEQLRKAIVSNSVPHSYLFSGISGIGKRLIAREAAMALLCAGNSKNGEACGNCPICQKTLTGTNPDLLEIAPENGVITIDVIREIKNQLRFSPMNGICRSIIIDQAEMMNANAANAALKILEEPPAGNHFFLITATPTQLLPTIISRCQKIEFSPLTDRELIEHLTKQHSYTSEDAAAAARVAGGSIEKALNITPELIDSVHSDVHQLLKSYSATGVLEISEKWASDKENLEKILYVLHRVFHEALLDATKKEQASVQNNAGQDGLIKFIRSKYDSNQLAIKCSAINRLHAQINRTYNKQLMFEQLLINLAGS